MTKEYRTNYKFVYLHECVDKEVSGPFFKSSDYFGSNAVFGFRFKDGTYILAESTVRFGHEACDDQNTFIFREADVLEALEFGLINEEEFDRVKEEQQKARTDEEERERREYERLKAKFG